MLIHKAHLAITYHRGELVSPTSLMMFDNMEELGGVTRHQGTFALELQTSGQDLAGSALVIRHDGTKATFNRLLSVDFPECDALGWHWREGKTELSDNGSVIIGAVYYNDGQEVYTWDCETLEERGMYQTLKDNEWTVVLRLVVSTGDTDQLAVSLGTIGRAQALYMNLDDKVYLLWMKNSTENALTLPEGAELFDGIMGYSGFALVTLGIGGWEECAYYAVTEDGTFPIAESFGLGVPRDYTVDLDGDGVMELVCNVQFGGDGAERVYVYQRRADGIFRGYLDTEDLPGHFDWGINSVWEEYDPVENVFRIHYAVEGQDDYAVLEAHGLERIDFEKYQS